MHWHRWLIEASGNGGPSFRLLCLEERDGLIGDAKGAFLVELKLPSPSLEPIDLGLEDEEFGRRD